MSRIKCQAAERHNGREGEIRTLVPPARTTITFPMCADKPLRHFSKKYTGGSYRDRTCAPGITRLAGFQDRGIATLPNFLKLKNILVPQAGVEPACLKAAGFKPAASTDSAIGTLKMVPREGVEPSTPWPSTRRSTMLSYRGKNWLHNLGSNQGPTG